MSPGLNSIGSSEGKCEEWPGVCSHEAFSDYIRFQHSECAEELWLLGQTGLYSEPLSQTHKTFVIGF